MTQQHLPQCIRITLNQIPIPLCRFLLLVNAPHEMIAGDEIEGVGTVPFGIVVDDLVGAVD